MSDSDETFSEEDIAAIAKQIWEEEGKPEGKAEEHWEMAKRHLAVSSRTNGTQPA